MTTARAGPPDHDDGRGPLWSRGFGEISWVMWGAYLVLPPVLGLLFTPTDELASPARVGFNITCNAIGTLCIAGVAHLLYALALPRIFSGRYRPHTRLVIHVGVLLAAVLVGAELSLLLERPRHPGLDDALLRALAYRNSLPLGVVLLLVLLLVDRLTLRAYRSEQRERAVQRLAERAQTEALQARTHPHFLLNSLNALSELVHQSPPRAEEALLQLAELYRYTLSASRMTRVPLRRELDAVRDYVALERLRFGERLRFTSELDPEALTATIPPLSLQPLVENAIRHGLSRAGGGRVHLRARATASRVTIEITDDGAGAHAGASSGTGSSLAELATRLTLLYGDAASLAHGPRSPDEGGGYRVTLQLPRRPAAPGGAPHARADRG
ncbi:MAG: histidine kinase [Myxococcales bacterium]|nr:histidine kinase [Myxococcales bacterium]